MRIDNGTIYPPDLLAFPVVYNGDPIINGIAGNQTVATLSDVVSGGGDGVPGAQDMAQRFAFATTQGADTPSDPCSKWSGWQYYACKATDFGTFGLGGDLFNKAQGDASAISNFSSDLETRAGLFLLALLVLGIGLWAILK